MKPEESIEELWATFESAVLPSDASEVRRSEMHKAFFAGFAECFRIMNDLAELLTERQAVEALNRLNGEIRAFMVAQRALHLAALSE